MTLRYKYSTTKDLYYTFTQLLGWLYEVNGYDRNIAYNGSTTRNMGIRMNGTAPTFNANVNGSLTPGTYYYFYTYYNSDSNVESEPSATSAAMTAAANPNDGITINIPANASVDTQVTSVLVYRTVSGGSLLYYEDEVPYDGTATTYNSINADSTLVTPFGEVDSTGTTQLYTNGLPITRPYIYTWNNRVWTWGVKTYTTGTATVTNANATVTGVGTAWTDGMAGMQFRSSADAKVYYVLSVNVAAQTLVLDSVYEGITGTKIYAIYPEKGYVEFSYIDSRTNFIYPEQFPYYYYLPVDPDDGNTETGLGSVMNKLLLCKDGSLYTVSGDTPANFGVFKINSPTGCVAGRTIANDSLGRAIFLSDRGIWMTDGVTAWSISKDIENIFTHEGQAPYFINTNKLIDCHAVFDSSKNKYFFWHASSNSSVCNKVLMGDFNMLDGQGNPQWFIFDIDANASAIGSDADGKTYVYFGDEDGYIYKIDTSTNDGAGSSVATTRRGTVTSSTANSLTDSTATFNTAGDGYKSLYVSIVAGTGVGQRKKILSNTATAITITTNWDTSLDTTSVYAVGAINSYWRTKFFTFDSYKYKLIRYIKLIFKRVTTSYGISINRCGDYCLEDRAETDAIYGGNETVTVDMYVPPAYRKVFFSPNKAIVHQLTFSLNDVDRPFSIKELEITLVDRGRE
jgi:hypothetical protein